MQLSDLPQSAKATDHVLVTKRGKRHHKFEWDEKGGGYQPACDSSSEYGWIMPASEVGSTRWETPCGLCFSNNSSE